MFKVGDIVSTDTSGGIKPPCGTVGVVSHYGVDNIDPSGRLKAVVVRFEDYPSAIYHPDDLTILTAPPTINFAKVSLFKLGEYVVTTEEIQTPYMVTVKAGFCLAVDKQVYNVLHVSHLGGPLFEVLRDQVKDYWDTRIAPQRDTIPTLPFLEVTYCSLPGCKAENDYSPAVTTCWRCGHHLSKETRIRISKVT